MSSIRLDLHTLSHAYDEGLCTPTEVAAQVAARLRDGSTARQAWIHVREEAELLQEARRIEDRRRAGEALPLYGIPFAVKDNIDVAGWPTTAACPGFGYVATQTAPAVERLLAAGALLVGKTNLDQFAAGLVGVRSPYGACSSVFDERYISGGSSSGSAVTVAAGLVSFALGTDTAGSGRVPAAFNNLIGWKPTRGLVSTRGVVPACRSLDCVSVFALTAADAQRVARVIGVFDPADDYSRPAPASGGLSGTGSFRFGVPRPEQREFFGDDAAKQKYEEALKSLEAMGGVPVEIDYTPFRETAELLYAGPWLAERLAAIETFYRERSDAMHPVTAGIIGGGAKYSAVDTFRALYRLEALRQAVQPVWSRIDCLALPTAPTIYTIKEVEADPVRLNTRLGYYTNFVNLLDLCGVAVPAGFRPDGLPFGLTLLAPAFADDAMLQLAGRFHRDTAGTLGGSGLPVAGLPLPETKATLGRVKVAVVGAHLTGQPLNSQLVTRGARLVETTRTAGDYRLFALPGTTPPKPGLVKYPGFLGTGIEVEVWEMDEAAFGSFVNLIPPPLGIGSLVLVGGQVVKGFLCEPYATDGARDITHFGGWRRYLGSLAANKGQEPSPPHVRSSHVANQRPESSGQPGTG